MDKYEMRQDTKEMLEVLRKQRERVTSSKKEAKKFLKELGIWHLLVPKEKKPRRYTGKK